MKKLTSLKKGTIHYKGMKYDLLSNLLNNKVGHDFSKLYTKYRKNRQLARYPICSYLGSTIGRTSSWKIENDMLFLTGLYIEMKDEKNTSRFPKGIYTNVLQEIFKNKNEVFASFITQEISIALSSKIENGHEIVQELHLTINEGIVTNTRKEQNEYITMKCYIEE